MTNILGPYYDPWHWRKEDEDFMAALDPAWVLVHQPSARSVYTAQRNAPSAKIMLRSWDIDDNNGERKREMYADPKGAARKHLAMWRAKWEELVREMRANGWEPDESRWYCQLVNEPDPAFVPQVVEYSLEAMLIVRGTLIRLGLVVSSEGNFKKPSEGDDGWTLFKPLEQPINDGGHILMVHEYWEPKGPDFGEDGGNHAWRHRIIPLDVPILIGEAGANGYIENRYTSKDDGGWGKYMEPWQFAAQVKEYIEGCDTRVKGVLLYMLDYHSDQWESFDIHNAIPDLLAIKDARPQVPSPFAATPPFTAHIPVVGTGDAATPPPVPPPAVPFLVHPIVDPAKRVVSQRFGVGGHRGIDYAIVSGAPIAAVDAGQVQESGFDANGYGEYIKIRHPWGESLYAHLSRRKVEVGAHVDRGNVIGNSGNTGNSTGPHLHFAMRVDPYNRADGWDGFSDPAPYLAGTHKPTSHQAIVAAIRAAALEFDVDADLLLSQAWAESSFNPYAVSEAGAQGLFQFMPATWAEWGPKVGASDPFDVTDSARVGAAYMRWLINTLKGNEYNAVVAHNAGIGNVLSGVTIVPITYEYANKVIHGRDLLKAVGG